MRQGILAGNAGLVKENERYNTTMPTTDTQLDFWNRVAWEKTFSHPINLPLLRTYLPPDSRILDYGCGYGRISNDLYQAGYTQILGVDPAPEMIRRGRQLYPHLQLDDLPLSGLATRAKFDAVLIVAVLTAVPSDAAQRELISTVERALRPGGLLFISDLLLQEDERNLSRYEAGAAEFGTHGVFRLPEGAVVRHHSPAWIESLTKQHFKQLHWATLDVVTMNGNVAKAFQYLGVTGY